MTMLARRAGGTDRSPSYSMIRSALLACVGVDDWRSLSPVDVLLVRHDADCGYAHAGRAYAPLTDTIGDWCEELGLKVRAVAAPYSRLRGAAAAHNPVSINRPMLATALLGRAVRAARGSARGIAWADACRARLWEALLHRARPRIVIGINPDPALCQAGRRLRIPVYDLQHGLIDNETPWYAGMAAAFPGAECLPTGILCWDRDSAVEVERWAPARGVAVHVIGNPWLARFQEADPGDSLVNAALAQFPSGSVDRPRILVSLQWGLAELHRDEEGFNGVMADALEQTILATADRFDWMLRLHPVQLHGDTASSVRSYLQRTFGALPSVEWQRSSTVALPTILRCVSAHVTDSSSVVMEAARFGVPSALLNPILGRGGRLERAYAAERQAGLAEVVAQDSASLIRWLEAQMQRPRPGFEVTGGRTAWMGLLKQLVAAPSPHLS